MLKFTNDGFVWLVISKAHAEAQFCSENGLSVYMLGEDDSDREVVEFDDFENHDGEFAIEGGFPAPADLKAALIQRLLSLSGFDNASEYAESEGFVCTLETETEAVNIHTESMEFIFKNLA